MQSRPLARSLDCMEEELQAACGKFSLRQVNENGYSNVEAKTAGKLEVITIRAGGMKIVRDKKNLRADNRDRFGLVLQDVGSADMYIGSNHTHLVPGDVMLVDTSQKTNFVFGGDIMQQRVVHLEREGLYSEYLDTSGDGISIAHDNPLSTALHSVINSLTQDLGASAEPTTQYLTNAFYDLLGAAMHGPLLSKAPTEKRKTIELVLVEGQRLIDQKFRDSNLSAAHVADTLNVSPRQLQRAFKLADEAPQQRILKKRLQWSRDRLIEKNKGLDHRLVATIAYDAGFSDLSYFNRAFRKAFQVSPGRCKA